MKATFKLLGLALIIFLSSCSNDMLIVKRKYNKGYYVNTGGKVKHQESPKVKNNETPEEAVVETAAVEPIVVAEMPLTASAENKPVAIAKGNSPKGRLKTTLAQNEQTNVAFSKKEQKQKSKLLKKATKREVRSAKKLNTRGDDQLILLVILSIFPILALLAMYIHDGHQVTLNFWVDLLLHFTVIGYLIFALLVVFNIIDLA